MGSHLSSEKSLHWQQNASQLVEVSASPRRMDAGKVGRMYFSPKPRSVHNIILYFKMM